MRDVRSKVALAAAILALVAVVGGCQQAPPPAGAFVVAGDTDGAIGTAPNAGLADLLVVRYDGGGSRVWARQLGTVANDFAAGVATDGAGDAVVAGSTAGVMPGNVAAGGNDLFVAKYAVSGDRRWVEQLGTAGDELAYGITADAGGNATVVGTTTGALPGFLNAGQEDVILAKLAADGNEVWAVQFGTMGDDIGAAVTVDASGDSIVAGETTGALPGVTNPAGFDVLLAKYDPRGNQLWAVQVGTGSNDFANAVTTDSDGHILVAGMTFGAFPGQTQAGNGDVLLLTFDGSGNLLSARQFGTPAYDIGMGVAADGRGGAFIVGNTQGAFPGRTHAGGNDVFLARLDAAGSPLWAAQFGSAADDYGTAIAAQPEGDVIVVGNTLGALPGETSAGFADMVVAKYGADGRRLWGFQTGTDGADFVSGVAEATR